jgi:hypothetical protein
VCVALAGKGLEIYFGVTGGTSETQNRPLGPDTGVFNANYSMLPVVKVSEFFIEIHYSVHAPTEDRSLS